MCQSLGMFPDWINALTVTSDNFIKHEQRERATFEGVGVWATRHRESTLPRNPRPTLMTRQCLGRTF